MGQETNVNIDTGSNKLNWLPVGGNTDSDHNFIVPNKHSLHRKSDNYCMQSSTLH